MHLFRKTVLFLLCLLLLPAFSVYAEEQELTITPPAGREDAIGYLTDNKAETRLTLESQKSVLVEWEIKDAAFLLISWYEPTTEVLIEVLDETGTAVTRRLEKNTGYRQQVNVTGGTKVRITSQRGQSSIAELRLYRVGETIPYTETDIYEADLLVICAGATEECRLLGGLLPLYTREHNIRTAIVYIRSEYGYVANEAFEALSQLGVDMYPVFMNRNDQNAATEDRVLNNWRTTLTTDLWQIVRKIKPKVIVTLDPSDETQPARVRAAAKTVRKLVETYTRKTDMPLMKFYTLSAEGGTLVDWKVPLSSFEGQTAFDVASKALLCYDSMRMFGYSVPEQSRFALCYSTVGEDIACNDLFEHIDAGTLISYAGATPLPKITPEPTPEPTPVPVVGSLSVSDGPTNGGLGALALAACAALMALLLKKKHAAAATALICLLLFGTGISVRAEALPEEAVTEAQAETEPSESLEPAENTEVPSPTDDYWYRQSDDPQEVIVSDYVTGHWEYRSDSLSIIIDRESFELGGNPQCIYVAYIRSRDIDCFRCGLASASDNNTLIMPWRMARTYKAVLAITGDNLTNAETSAKGILIRNGTFYSDCQGEDTLAVYSSAKIGLIKKGTVTGLQLLDSGVRNSYSFGPVLVENGEVNPDVSKHRVAKGNPRCGIGMIEEGCLVAIVADGRDPKRAFNLTLEEFAEIFKSKGVSLAYNLDGGNSTAMIFMGESISCHSGKSGQRTWVDSLLWGYSEQVPDTGDPIIHYGESPTGYYS